MPRKRLKPLAVESDSLSEEVDDFSEDFIRPKRPKTEPKVQLDWIEKYAPKSSDDVCVNPKKLRELKEAMLEMVLEATNCRILVVHGPSGCGKSTSVKCLGDEIIAEKRKEYMGQNGLSETQHGQNTRSDTIVEFFDTQLDEISHVSQFSEFLDGCRYRIGSNLAFIVVEELPNVFHHDTLLKFRSSLRDWIYSLTQLPPLVICLTEVEIEAENGQKSFYNIENSLTAETLLGRDLIYHASAAGLLKKVKFLPIAKTFMKKALLKIIKQEKVQIPPGSEADLAADLFETGDIRALIGKLQFFYGNSGQFSQISMSRENSISLFHAAGKIIYSSGKFADLDDNSSDFNSVQTVLDTYGNFPLLNLALLENYQIYNGLDYDLAIAASLVDSLSISDTLKGVRESYEYGIRAVRQQLRSITVTHGKIQNMKFPRHFKMLKVANKVRKEVENYKRYIGNLEVSFDDINLVDGFLIPGIYNSFRYKLQNGQKQFSYNRVGGKFQEIFADNEVTVMENENEREAGIRDQFAVDIEQKLDAKVTSDNEPDLSDEIAVTSTDEDFNDSLDDRLITMTQQPVTSERRHSPKSQDSDSEFSDDPELYMLVSQGKL